MFKIGLGRRFNLMKTLSKPFITLIITLLCLSCASPLYSQERGLPAGRHGQGGELIVLSDKDYFPATLNAINAAKSEIAVSMYLIQIDPNDTADPAYKLTEALANAAKRGVRVKVVLENDKYKDNMAAFNMLAASGVSVCYDDPYGFVHDKIIVVDRSISIVGSHNWSELALSGNHDTSLLVRSDVTAAELLAHISSIRLTQPFLHPASLIPNTSSLIPIPVSFFKGKNNPCAKLFRNHADKLFDLYLLLLKENKPSFTVDYERLGKAIGLNREGLKDKTTEYYCYYYRDLLRHFLSTLDKDYGLIKYDSKQDTVSILANPTSNLPHPASIPASTPITQLPLSYWKHGWNTRLTFAAKYFYLVALNESNPTSHLSSPISTLWWELPREDFVSKYGMNRESVSNAILELQRYDILDIYRESAKKLDLFWMKKPNKYLLKALYDPADLERAFAALKKKYGSGVVEQARGLAGELNTPNNLADVEKFIDLIKRYGYPKVKAANSKTAALAPQNGKRHIGYTIKILEATK